jgi:RimJ/RimL family protein N-acetyltransferase
MYETKRLILRQWRDSDLIPFAAMGQDPLVMEYFPELLSFDETQAAIDRMKTKFAKDGFCFYACELKETHEFIGFIGLSVPSFTAHFTPCVEIGWRIASKHWGMGYATEGALKCLDIGFNEFMLDEIISIAVANNFKSRNVMQKIGMQQDVGGTFLHPNFAPDHPLARHVLYRIKA